MKPLFYLVATIFLVVAINPRVGKIGNNFYAASCNLNTGIYIDQDGVRFIQGMEDGGIFAPFINIRWMVGCS